MYKHFGEYLSGLKPYGEWNALTIRPFIKIERLTFDSLRMEVYQTARYLQSLGIKKGDRIVLVAFNSPSWMVLFLSAQVLGVIVAPLDASLGAETIRSLCDQVEPVYFFCNSFRSHDFKGHMAGKLISIEDLHILAHDFSSEPITAKIHDELASVIVFTSGTTADPKGVVLTQRNILSNVSGVQERIAIDPNWRLLSVLPLSHMYELTGSLAVLSQGASICYMPRVTASAIARALQEYKITTMLAVPQLLEILLDKITQTAEATGKVGLLRVLHKVARGLPFPARRVLFHPIHKKLGGSLNLVVTGGAPVPPAIARNWEEMGVTVLQGYGLTETSPILTANALRERRMDSPGKILSGVHLRIGKDGEIQAKGASIFREYWRQPKATREAFTKDGWFKTGDSGSLKDGWLYIQGRIKFAIVLSSGLKVFPEDIESRAEHDPILKELCIIGTMRPEGEVVTAVIVSDKNDDIVQRAIDALNNRVEPFQRVAAWRRWPEDKLPRTRLLKVDRRSVQSWAAQEKTSEGVKAGVQPSDTLTGLIKIVLHKDRLSVEDKDELAAIGLDSLRRLSLVALIEEKIGITIPEEFVTARTTIGAMKQLIEKGTPTEQAQTQPSWPFNPIVRRIGFFLRETIVRAVVRIWVRTTVVGQENLSNMEMPAIFIFNHVDTFDGPVILQSLPRSIRFRTATATAKDILEQHKLLAFGVRFCGAGFSLSRTEPYLPSLEYIGHLVDAGWSIAIAPEGKVSLDGKLQDFKQGIGLLAVQLGVPIVPIKTNGLAGTIHPHAKWPSKRSKVTIRIGNPLYFEPTDSYEQVTKQLHDVMEQL